MLTFGVAKLGAAVRSAILRAGLVGVILCPTVTLLSHTLRWNGLKVASPLPAGAIADFTRHDTTVASIADQNISPQQLPVVLRSRPMEVTDEASRPIDLTTPPAVIRRSAGANRLARLEIIARVFVIGWTAISAVLLLRLAAALVLLAIARRTAADADEEISRKCYEISQKMGVRSPRVLVTSRVSGPCLVGVLRPVILLPPGDCDASTEILIHELAHLVRYDCAWHLGARCVASIIWFQPLMWFVLRDIERTAEEASDDAVIAFNGDRTSYARALANLAEKSQTRWAMNVGIGVVGIRSSVGRRIERLLSITLLESMRLSWRARVAVMLLALPAIGLGIVQFENRALANGKGNVPANAAGLVASGRVLDVDGKPVAGASVFVVSGRGYEPEALADGQTDARGEFSLAYPKLNDGAAAGLQIQAYAPGKGIAVAAVGESHQVEPCCLPTTQIKVTLKGPDGKPVVGLTVRPIAFISSAPFDLEDSAPRLFMRMPVAMSRRMSATTDADGSVIFRDLPRETRFELGFDDDRYAYLPLDKRIPVSASAAVSEPATRELQLAATVTGVVEFATTGKPAAGIEVSAEPMEGGKRGHGGSAMTDASGHFVVMHLPPGQFNLLLHLGKTFQNDWTAAAHEGMSFKPGERRDNVNFELIKGGIITGKVVAADTGQPILGAGVGIYGPAHPRSSSSIQSAEVNDDGTYMLRVPPGEQYVYITDLPRNAYRRGNTEKSGVTVADGQTVSTDFKLPRRAGAPVNGIVIGVDGKPAQGIPVSVDTDDIGDFLDHLLTDSQGRFHFDALAAGTPIFVRAGQLATTKPVKVARNQGEIRLQLVRRV
jgi:beta-lactamase regulating signal transducer with metallopeptidase domain/5-hydroxyisourate hydrolase-like protein (transthyretin family)